MIKAPTPTSFRVRKLASNYLELAWDDVGSNFYYFIEYRVITNPDNPPDFWQNVTITADTNHWIEELGRNTYYQYRIRTGFRGFEDSDWAYTEMVQTFPENAHNITIPDQFQIGDEYLQQRFKRDRRTFVDFNEDQIQYSMMVDGFQFDSGIDNISSYSDSIIKDEENHRILGEVPQVCYDQDRVMMVELEGVLYAIERFQSIVKVSNDNGQNWIAYNAFNDRAGNPIADVIAYQNNINTFVLGYDRIFAGVTSEEVFWSSDSINMSNNEVTFVDITQENPLGFQVEVFGELAKLPAEMQTRVEAFACSNRFLYVAARDKVKKINLEAKRFDDDPQSPTFGEAIFEDDEYTVTGNPYSVVKKMDWFNDELYAFVSGQVKTDTGGNRYDPAIPENIEKSSDIGIYRFTEDTQTFTRVYGNTQEERDALDHKWSDMSTNGRELFVDYYNWTSKTLVDQDLIDNDDSINYALTIDKSNHYATSKKRYTNCLRTVNGDDWYLGPYEYYAETKFHWLARSGDRSWKGNDHKAVVVYGEKTYTFDIENTNEFFNEGVTTVQLDNISERGFTSYCSGVVLHKNTGEVVGFYRFPYRVRDSFDIFWRPERTLITATLAGQTRPEDPVFEQPNTLRDPILTPYLRKMAPESYVQDDSLYTTFAENYLKFISEGKYGFYRKMYNAIKNKYPREDESINWLWSEIYRRNIYLDEKKREEVVRFFESRSQDFYSSKGTEASYKFLFKLLYNEDVEIEIESKNSFEYDILVESGNITEDIVGTRIGTPTGVANVTYIEREYNEQGTLQWRITIHNVYGKFVEGQTIDNTNGTFTGVVKRGILGKQLSSNSRDYLDRGRSYYVMKIKSALPTSRYKNDVIRFVHPTGFGFIGITLITVLINSGISATHLETIINRYKSLRFDSGLPSVYPDEIPDLDEANKLQFDAYGNVILKANPLAGQSPTLPPDYDTQGELWGLLPSERRREWSPIFDASWVRWSNLLSLLSMRLKDNIGNPRDPDEPTQRKLDE